MWKKCQRCAAVHLASWGCTPGARAVNPAHSACMLRAHREASNPFPPEAAAGQFVQVQAPPSQLSAGLLVSQAGLVALQASRQAGEQAGCWGRARMVLQPASSRGGPGLWRARSACLRALRHAQRASDSSCQQPPLTSLLHHISIHRRKVCIRASCVEKQRGASKKLRGKGGAEDRGPQREAYHVLVCVWWGGSVVRIQVLVCCGAAVGVPRPAAASLPLAGECQEARCKKTRGEGGGAGSTRHPRRPPPPRHRRPPPPPQPPPRPHPPPPQPPLPPPAHGDEGENGV